MPLFSIIVPTYDSELTIGRCLDSILSQAFHDFEVLIMDGVSTDKTIKIINDYGDQRIKLFSEPDKGIYDAMNKGIRLAQGEWLYFLGSDDAIFDNEVLAKIAQVICTTCHKIIYGNVRIVGNSGWSEDKKIYDENFDLKKLLDRNICHQAIFYHYSIFEKVGNYTICYKLHADYDFNLKCFSQYKFLYVNLLIARFQGGGRSFLITAEDEEYGMERWKNISNYYRWHLYKKAFFPYIHMLERFGEKTCMVKLQLRCIKIRLWIFNLIKGHI